MEASGYLSKPLSLSNGFYFNSNDVVELMIKALKDAVKEEEIPVDLLYSVFRLIKPENGPYIANISRDHLLNISQLATSALQKTRCSRSKVAKLNEVLFSQILLSMRLTESPQELNENPAYHGGKIQTMVYQIAQGVEGSLFDVAHFLDKYTQFIFKTTPAIEDSKPFFIRDSIKQNPHYEGKNSIHHYTISYPSNDEAGVILKERLVRKEIFGWVTWSEAKKEAVSYPSFTDLQKTLIKGFKLFHARTLTALEQDRFVRLTIIRYHLKDPYRTGFLEKPVIDSEGNTHSKMSMRGDLRSANEKKNDEAYLPNHLVERLILILDEEMDSLNDTFGQFTTVLTNPITDMLYIHPVVGPDGYTYEKDQIPEKDAIPNKQIEKILEILKKPL